MSRLGRLKVTFDEFHHKVDDHAVILDLFFPAESHESLNHFFGDFSLFALLSKVVILLAEVEVHPDGVLRIVQNGTDRVRQRHDVLAGRLAIDELLEYIQTTHSANYLSQIILYALTLKHP